MKSKVARKRNYHWQECHSSPGFILYLFYGYQHSTEAIKPANQREGEFFLPETPNIQKVVNKPQIQWYACAEEQCENCREN